MLKQRSRLLARALLIVLAGLTLQPVHAGPLQERVDRAVEAVEDKVIAWRRDIHQHPELANREFRTAALVAAHLRELGMAVRTEVAHTGVVGVLEGGRPGRVVALRADMDALPITEQTGLPFASTVRADYEGREVGVMHACGHDAHTAILMGAAQVLAGIREEIAGTIVFIFQPAEEGPPEGEDGGAKMMIDEGVLQNPRPEAIFGLHLGIQESGSIHYASGPIMSSSDRLHIRVIGRQSHGASPWVGIDPVVVSSQIILGLQTIHSRQVDTRYPHVISIGMVEGGQRFNIIPGEIELIGTVRAQEEAVRVDVHERIVRTATSIAASAGATAEVRFLQPIPVTVNDPDLTARMLPTLQRAAGQDKVLTMRTSLGYEDFAFYAQEIPGLFFFLGTRAPGQSPRDTHPVHTPYFNPHEGSFVTGVRALASLAVDFLHGD